MNHGIIYFNRGTKCTIRLVVSLCSLRKYYNRSVTIICSGEQEMWFLDTVQKLGADIVYMPERKGDKTLALKSSLWRYSPYDLTMFMDADTLVLNPVDEYFQLIEKYNFVTGHFANWKTKGGTISRRIRQWGKVAPDLIEDAINFGPAVNTGINGWKKDAPILKAWEAMSLKGQEGKCSLRVLDELACQILLPQYQCYIAGTEWGESVKYGKYDDSTVIIHYHGNKHAGDRIQNNLWKIAYNELVRKFSLDHIRNNSYGDRALRGYLKSVPKNVTVVTAVNNTYFKKFINNFPLWMKVENLMELPFIVFAHKECIDKVKTFLSEYPQVKIVSWDFEKAETSREEMLSAFVFGTAREVTSKYWMKLDCDCTPKTYKLHIPNESFKSVITASSWGYTKMKSDPNAKKHWLNTLDDWADSLVDFKGTEKMFPENIEGKRYRHRRICSFCEIEKTNWTKHLAAMCGNRLPIPSQDTVTWYAAKRLGRKIITHKFRNYLQP